MGLAYNKHILTFSWAKIETKGVLTMKKIILLIVAFVFTFSMTAFAADKVADVKAPEVNKTDVKKADVKKHHHKRHFLRGEVKAIDVQAGSITIAGKKGEKTIAADAALLKDIKVGDKVYVKTAKKDGKLTATKIKSAADKKEHAKKHLRGEVKAIDSKAGTITIAGKKGEKTVSADAAIVKDVKVGDKVFVKVSEQDGKLTAASIKSVKELKAKRAERKAAKEKKAADGTK
jgi:Cu/Ag efflux protein CusF